MWLNVSIILGSLIICSGLYKVAEAIVEIKNKK